MNKKILAPAITLFLMTLSTSTASAAPIMWTLQNVTFQSGATGSGSFVYDATTNVYSSINLSVSAFPGSVFQFPYLFTASNSTTLEKVDSNAANLTGAHVLALGFISPLTNAGGTTGLVTNNSSGADFYTTCTDSFCGSASSKILVTNGSVTTTPGTPTPEPVTLSLILPALFALSFARRRR